MCQNLVPESYHSEAYDLAMAKLIEKNPKAPENAQLREELVMAIIELAYAGQKSPEQLARYGVSRCKELV